MVLAEAVAAAGGGEQAVQVVNEAQQAVRVAVDSAARARAALAVACRPATAALAAHRWDLTVTAEPKAGRWPRRMAPDPVPVAQAVPDPEQQVALGPAGQGVRDLVQVALKLVAVLVQVPEL